VAAVWVLGFAALRVSLLAPEVCPPIDDQSAVRAAVAAADWLVTSQDDDGRYLYEYDRAAAEPRPGYNIVRHAGVTMSLYQAAAAGHDAVLDAADDGLAYMLDELVRAGDGAALVEPGAGTARLGASALLAAALVDRRIATGERRYDDELRALGRFMVGQIGRNGRTLVNYDVVGQVPVPGETSRYATGEAGWALARLHTSFPDEGWDRPARLVADYLATERDEAEGLDYPPWPDQWAAYLLGELAPDGLDPHHVTYARALAARFGMLIRFESQKDGWPVPVVDPRARGGGVGVWVEGLASLARAAAVDDRLADLRPALRARLDCGASVLAARQADADEAAEYRQPDRVNGAWFRDDLTRMDDQQHALSGLLAAAGRFGGDR
jgi:hypothetical protein